MDQKKIWVIKIGSQSVIEGGSKLISRLMKEVIELKEKYHIVWVTSGAIALAKEQWPQKKVSDSLPAKQALSAIGQPLLYHLYEKALGRKRFSSAQILISASDLEQREQRNHFLNTLNQLLLWDFVPIINENDAVATDEIKFGDNDQLASLIALETGAHRLTLLSNVDGLLDVDGDVIKQISRIQREHFDLIEEGTSTSGTGGMLSKLRAAERASNGGVVTDIVNATRRGVLSLLESGDHPGTEVFSNAR